ncbi:hypothetical protein H7F15_16775 [Pontibacter sp. Tf4]|uniref:Ig-like domain-containing protein n=1 Tax=Pontibacter sp. Tf4 TaxID=2761620 RepID=UPI0016287C5B|nr:hypothetical protein [Pontibacter sp. Tf4]MBB6612699.1 hypothetical protein [Pontibacter sp. Tf4]
MKKHIPLLAMLLLLLWSCDKTTDDVLPASFKQFQLYPDDIYIINANSDWINRLDVLANDSVKVQVDVTYTEPLHGDLHPEFDGPGTMGYKPHTDFAGLDSLYYTVCVGKDCQTEKVRLIVEKPGDPNECKTVLGQDSLTTKKNTPGQVRIFLNDTICFGENYGGNSIESPRLGTFETIEYSGSYKNTIYVYYPPKDYVGQDSFRYRVYTSRDRSTYEEVIVTVTVTE